jgi:hypothetical protein
VAIDYDLKDTIASGPASQWAIARLRSTLESKGVAVRVNEPGAADLRIAVCGPTRIKLPDTPEMLAIGPNASGLYAGGTDERGISYALTELADRVAHSTDPRDALAISSPIVESPANRIRAIMRLFVTNVEDKKWFYDRDFWTRYLDMLAAQRFNRFNLALGLGYDAANRLTDTYFFFSYPYLVNVPGFNVRATPLPDEERELNLQTVKYISEQTALRGMQFQLGLWTHGFKWNESPNANYVIEGLTTETQEPYCRDALHMLLQECPAIGGVTLRIHGESGVAEGNYGFWKSIFLAAASTGRKIEIDMHGKGMDQKMIDTALESGLPVTVSPKFWAEHMGLPYMQTAIRQAEMPTRQNGGGLMALSSGSRSFLRYSYGDLIKKDRKYSVLHRVWPGTQRLLLWGDPMFAAAYGRNFSFCGTDGVEYFDPLSFKGRKGSGLPNNGGRDGYADASMRPAGGDWEKFLYTYRLLGRLSYNPNSDPEVWRRAARDEFGPQAEAMEKRLGAASRILPLITSSHCPSAANANYWPEVYLNMSIVDGNAPGPYTDTPRPRDFCHVSPLDPQIFSTAAECARELLNPDKRTGKYSPLDVARQLLIWSDQAGSSRPAPVDRAGSDAWIASGVGAFFAWKFRAAVLIQIFDATGNDAAKSAALQCYRAARNVWSERTMRNAYLPDLTFGPDAQLRGHWRDRLPAIDHDIEALAAVPAKTAVAQTDVSPLIASVMNTQGARPTGAAHVHPGLFKPTEPLWLELRLTEEATSAKLWYRHVNQGENFQQTDMKRNGNVFSAAIPADYTDSPFALQYYFEIHQSGGQASLHPGLGVDYADQPYYLVQQA